MQKGHRLIAIVLLLWGAVAIAYLPAVHYGYCSLDDPQNIRDNPRLKMGLTRAGVHWAMTAYLLGHWTPLVRLSYLLDQTLFELNPGVMHAEDLCLHAAASSMLLILLVTATGAVWRSTLVAALFALHPMHVESVVWLTERRDVMSALLLFASLWAYVRYARAGPPMRAIWFLSALTLYALSLMSKAMGITLPALLVLLDFWPLQREITGDGGLTGRNQLFRIFLEKVPFAALAMSAAVVAIRAQHAAGATATLDALPLIARVENAAVTYPLYIAKLVVPINLGVFYPHPGTWPFPAIAAGAGILAFITFFAIRQRRQRPYLFVGWFWFVITLLPVSGLAQSGPQAMADRYSYIPSVGLFMAGVWFAGEVTRITIRRAGTPKWRTNAGVAGSILLVAIFAMITREQVGYWRDSATLFRHTLDATGNNWFAHWALGNMAADTGDIRSAVDEYNRSIADRAANPEAYAALGSCWQAQDPRRAIKFFQHAVALDPHMPRYRVALAATLFRLGSFDEANVQLRAALIDDPEYPSALAGLADVQKRRNPKGRS